MEVLGGHHGLAGSECVRERAAGDLVGIEIRSHVDIGREEEFDDVAL